MVDRYSNWPVVDKAEGGSKGLILCLKRIFVTFGIAEELASDGGTELTSHETSKFLENWGVYHRQSSTAFPHSNCRAEVGVKTVKRMLMDNVNADGSLETDKFLRAMLQYRNTPDPVTGISPAQCIFGRQIRDFIPVHPGKFEPHPIWQATMAGREEALRHRHMRQAELLRLHTKRLPPLKVGEHVRVQNQTGQHPLKWDKTGTVVEVRQFDQYAIRIDGSRRVTLRNRKFLRKFVPVMEKQETGRQYLPLLPIAPPIMSIPDPQITQPPTTPTQTQQHPKDTPDSSSEASTLPPTPATLPPNGTTPARTTPAMTTPARPTHARAPQHGPAAYDGGPIDTPAPAAPAAPPTPAPPLPTPSAGPEQRRSGRPTKLPSRLRDYILD